MVMNFVWMFKSFPFQDSTPSLFDDFCCFTFGISISKKNQKSKRLMKDERVIFKQIT